MVLNDWISTWKRINLNPYLTPYSNMNSKRISVLNRRTKTIKHFEENIRINLQDLGFGNGFLCMTPVR